VTGNTIFNVLAMGDLTVDSNDRPEMPPKILRTEILSLPFDDIIPRQLARGSVLQSFLPREHFLDRLETRMLFPRRCAS
jgi:hypothetical protein